MEKIKNILSLLFLLIVTTSCNKDFLDRTPLDEYSEASVWKDPKLVRTFVNKIYNDLGIPCGIGMISQNIDEAYYTVAGARDNFNKSLLTADQIPGWSGYTWVGLYKTIRATNIFFEKIESTPYDSQVEKDLAIGEVYFLRAYFYNSLVALYGGVPIIEKAYQLEDDFTAARNTYEECIEFIVNDLDKAASLLPEVQITANLGRATKGAALALKSHVLLYAASDLHKPGAFPSFSNPELLGYVGGDQLARWTRAKNAAQDVMDLNLYSLYQSTPANAAEAKQNYNKLFLTVNNVEDIFFSYFLSKNTSSSYRPGKHYGPNGYHCWGNNTPLGNLVDNYEMDDGTKFDWNNPAHAADPYTHRDPRFYATILYEGAKYGRPRPSDVISYDPIGVIQVGSWEIWQNNQKVIKWGLDTRKSIIEDWNGTYSNYYLKKFIDETIDHQFYKQNFTWRFIRYGEILLNYAEACIELGQDDEARGAINQIRQRAGMPPITESGDALRQRYRNERRIELAFEDQRFFDVRRWMIGPVGYLPARGVNVVYKLLPDNTTATTPTVTPMVFITRAWDDKAYFFPILRSEMNKNSLLIQNPGY